VHHGSSVECPACDFVHYANPVPAVSALVLDERCGLLLARRAHEPARGLWDTPGGFLDEREEPRAGLRRELREEAGVEIEIGRFVGIYPDTYGDGEDAPYVFNLVWEVSVVGGEPVPADDVSELRWFPWEELPADDELAFTWLAPVLADRTDRR
jgi:ADP-ribose pyrophosphatase